MGTLFLSGGGDKQHTEKFDQQFLAEIGIAKPLLYIPIAMKQIKSYEECYEWVESVFKPLGIQEISMWTDLNGKSLNDLEQFSAIYIGGGNTFSLLSDLRSSGFDVLLAEYVQAGGILYGGSAGAIILGSDIQTCAHLDSNDVQVTEFNGFGLIGDFAIWCHYSSSDDDLIGNYINKTKNPVLALPEETGAYVKGGMIRVTGTKPAYLFNETNKLELMPEAKKDLFSASSAKV